MSKIYKSNYVKINEPRKLENIFPAHFPTVDKNSEIPSDEDLYESEEFEEAVPEDEELEMEASEAELEATRIIEEAKELYKNILAEANREAHEMTGEARSEADSIRRNAYNEGFSSGMEDARNRIGSLIGEAQEIRDYMAARRDNQMREMEADMISLILDISRKVIGTELTQGETAIIGLMKNALSKSSFTEKAVLRVSSDDFEIVEANRINILRSVEGLSELQVVQDESLPPGSCVVDTPSGEINASVEVQLKELEKIFEFILRNDL